MPDIALPKKLFDIPRALAEVYEQIDESGEVTAEIEKTIDALAGAQSEKAGNILALIQKAEAESDAALQYAEYFSKKAEVRKALIQRLKAFVKQYMLISGTKKLETDRGMAFNLRNNGGLLPLKFDDGFPIAEVSDEFTAKKTTVHYNQEAIRAALDAGHELPFAKYAERGTHVVVK